MVAVVDRHRADARGRRRRAPRHVLGHRCRAPVVVRRLAGRSVARVGEVARPPDRLHPARSAHRPVQPGRRGRRRRRARPSRRTPAAVVGERRLVDVGRAARTLGGAGHGRRRATTGTAGRPRRPPTGRDDRSLRVDGGAAVRGAGGRRPADGPRHRRGDRRATTSDRGRAPMPRRPTSVASATRRCSVTYRTPTTSTCAARVR